MTVQLVMQAAVEPGDPDQREHRRELARAQLRCPASRCAAEAVSVDEAVDRADVLVLAVWLDAFKELIAQYGERLAGKVIVDPTNPVGPDGKGGFQKIIGEQESSGEILAACSRLERTWSRRSARCPRARSPRPHGASPSGRYSSTLPATLPPATWSPT